MDVLWEPATLKWWNTEFKETLLFPYEGEDKNSKHFLWDWPEKKSDIEKLKYALEFLNNLRSRGRLHVPDDDAIAKSIAEKLNTIKMDGKLRKQKKLLLRFAHLFENVYDPLVTNSLWKLIHNFLKPELKIRYLIRILQGNESDEKIKQKYDSLQEKFTTSPESITKSERDQFELYTFITQSSGFLTPGDF